MVSEIRLYQKSLKKKKSMILLSAHKDTVFQEYELGYSKGVHTGLLDNFAGMLLCYLTLYSDQNLAKFEKSGDIKIWHGNAEEWGQLDCPIKLIKGDIAIVVDVASGTQYKDKDFSIENISGFSKQEMIDLKDSLKWEGFNILFKKYDGTPDDEDEAWQWKKQEIKTFSFIIPIVAPQSWHNDNCSLEYEKMKKCIHGLRRVINYLL